MCDQCNAPASAYFGKGKGKGKGKGGGKRYGGNPKGKDDAALKCSVCQSDQHLWRQCTAPGSEEFKRRRAEAMHVGRANFTD
eukprot:2862608-Heterocapsa_arctica.AAC.1